MQSMNRPTFLAIKAHSPEKPVIVFVASRRQTRLTARDLINFCGMEDNPRRFLHMSEDDLTLNLERVKDDALRESLGFGIGLHHAGLVESDRSLSEELFANNKIQILIATSTLAWGVNLPAHLVVVKGTQFFDAKTEGYKDMDLTDVLQMLGRAGRPQFDSSGIARIFTQDAKKEFYKHFLHTGFPVESSLHKVLDNHLAAEISAGTITTKQDALDYITWTFFFRRLHKNPSFYGLEISAEEHNTIAAQGLANDYMIDLVETSLQALEESSCAAVEPTGEVDPTPYGKTMSYYYLSHRTIRHLLKNAKRHATFADALSMVSSATEYDELPVRHNEDLINIELAKVLPLDTASFELPMWDPHVKSFLLLQAHFSRIDLPITDYVGDLNSVLDQSIRILQASIDVMAELGYLSSCEMLITVLQAIKSARWPTDGPLSILPGVDVEKERKRTQDPKAKPQDLVGATQVSSSVLEQVGKVIGVPNSGLARFLEPISRLTKLGLEVELVTALSVKINVRRLNLARFARGAVRTYTPRFPKPQNEGFFIILSYSDTDDIIALKRLAWSENHQRSRTGKRPDPKHAKETLLQASITINVPELAQGKRVDVRVLSDTYLGMKWSIEYVEVPAAPILEGVGKMKEK